MRNVFPVFFVLFTFFLVTGCITPYETNVKEYKKRIVIDGLISNQPGPHRVRISYAAAYTAGTEGTNLLVSDATVYVTDNLKNRINYQLSDYGIYQTDAGITGQVGRSYQLHVQTSDGKEYVSEPEVLKPVPSIDTIYWEYNPGQKQISIFADIKDSSFAYDTYLLSWQHYERAYYINCISLCDFCLRISRCYSCVNLVTDQFVNGNTIRKQPISTVSFNFPTAYYLLIELRSLTNNGYQFWNSVKSQSTGAAGPFDIPPAPVVGNLYNVDDAEEKVLGFFGASSVLFVPYWIERSAIPDTPEQIQPENCPPGMCIPCREETGYYTKIKPIGWER